MKTQWFVYTGGDGFLNRIVSTRLEGVEIFRDLVCFDGVPRDLWPCDDHSVVREFSNLNRSDHLNIKFFVKEGQHGQIRPWNFENGPSSTSRLILARVKEFMRGRKVHGTRKACSKAA